MGTKAYTTVRLGDLVAVAFYWATQRSSNPREIPILATRAVTYLVRHSRKTSPSRPAPAALPPGDFRGLPAFETGGCPFGVSATTIE